MGQGPNAVVQQHADDGKHARRYDPADGLFKAAFVAHDNLLTRVFSRSVNSRFRIRFTALSSPKYSVRAWRASSDAFSILRILSSFGCSRSSLSNRITLSCGLRATCAFTIEISSFEPFAQFGDSLEQPLLMFEARAPTHLSD